MRSEIASSWSTSDVSWVVAILFSIMSYKRIVSHSSYSLCCRFPSSHQYRHHDEVSILFSPFVLFERRRGRLELIKYDSMMMMMMMRGVLFDGSGWQEKSPLIFLFFFHHSARHHQQNNHSNHPNDAEDDDDDDDDDVVVVLFVV